MIQFNSRSFLLLGRLAFLPAISLAALLASSQTPPPSAPVPLLRSTTRNVILDVVVTDANGKPVRGLSAADFHVAENNVPQSIRLDDASARSVNPQHLMQASNSSSPTEAKAASTPSASVLRTVILLDEMNVRFLDLAFARKRLEAFLLSPKSADQNIAILATTQRRSILVHNFTTDRAALLSSLRQLPGVAVASVGGEGNVDPIREEENMVKSFGVIEQLARAFAGSRDRVNVIWITSGFPGLAPMVASVEVPNTFEFAMKQASNLFMNSRISLYTIDPHGVQYESSLPNHNAELDQSPLNPGQTLDPADPAVAQVTRNILNSTNNQAVANSLLGQLDRRTGGRAYGNRNDIDIALGEAIDEGNSSYQISYSPIDKNFDGSYRKIIVKLTRPGLTARTRDGYYALSQPPELTPSQQTKRIETALESPFTYQSLHVSANLRTAAKPATIAVQIASPEADWAFDKGGAQARQLVAIVAYSSNNRPLLSRQWTMTTTHRSMNINAPIQYILPFEPPPGTARLRLAVADANGDRIGTAEVPLH